MSDVDALARSRKTEDRLRAVRLLTRSDAPDRWQALLTLLEDKVSYVATGAADALADCDVWPVLARLTERFLWLSEDGAKRDAGCHIRAKLAFTLGKQEYTPGGVALHVGIQTRQYEAVGGLPFDTAIHLRGNCALALAQMRDPDALRSLSLLLFDRGDNGVIAHHAKPSNTLEARKAAAQSLARLGSPAGRLPLTLKLAYPEGESGDILQECMQALIELEDPDALATLTPYLRHSDVALAAFAALMIAQTRDPQSPTLLRDLLPRVRGELLHALILALTGLRTPEADAVLTALRTDPRPDIRAAVTELWPDGSSANR